MSEGGRDFIDDARLEVLLAAPASEPGQVREIIAKSLQKEALTVEETAVLLRAEEPELIEEIYAAARQLKETVYGNRVVLFAPLYIGNLCQNDCSYCAFRRSNKEAVRQTLSEVQIGAEVGALVDKGHKRLVLVFGEHPDYDATFIANTARTVYETKRGPGEIRRVNINAAPLDHAGYQIVKEAGIGTYQIFHETYHHETYGRVHPKNTWKGDYLWRLDGPARSIEAGCDDVGIGSLFGLYDWRFETLGLVSHAVDLKARFGVGPHTISFPRIRPASGVLVDSAQLVDDESFKRIVAVLRLAVPYTGLILTAREEPELRRELMAFGVSQIDAGSRIEIGGYQQGDEAALCLERKQFALGDTRPLDDVMRELVQDGYLPSFCTACYRKGRTGEHFMEFAIPGFIKRFCTPNALLTLTEYLCDYASPETAAAAAELIADELALLPEGGPKDELKRRLKAVREANLRDSYL